VILKEWRGKYIIYDKNGKIVIITRDKKIAIGFARSKNDRV
tara:strand:+ start:174 stop:296 length:123 start_codon:yes stop_codon:yes gene_type:complete